MPVLRNTCIQTNIRVPLDFKILHYIKGAQGACPLKLKKVLNSDLQMGWFLAIQPLDYSILRGVKGLAPEVGALKNRNLQKGWFLAFGIQNLASGASFRFKKTIFLHLSLKKKSQFWICFVLKSFFCIHLEKSHSLSWKMWGGPG